jgi:DivIVA domain-containing protein
MADSETTEIRTPRFARSAADRLRDRTFPVAVRGYDRRAVDEFVQEALELVAELEGRQSRESVVQRALDEVGEETAGILQRAHETADEISARSRAQAEGRIQRAEREAEIMRRQADEYSEQVVVDTKLLWEERRQLIEDIRRLADEVLATADDAAERVQMPEPLLPAAVEEGEGDGPPTVESEEPPTVESDDPPTAEVELDVLQGGAEDSSKTSPPGQP